MSETALRASPTDGVRGFERIIDWIVAAGVLGILLVILVPLPTPLMDALLLTNLAASFLILLVVSYSSRALELSAFPTLLLVVTFARLALNVATTRLILGNAGGKELAAAGRVVEAFASLVAGQNLVVGLVIFTILVVVQFVVITKGTTRISEVAARFTLDAMPGKQLSIDGDLASGILTEDAARRLRAELGEEAAFYGAMDGASKFVRGEAVAGIFILLVNVLGGFFIGTVHHGMDVSRAAGLFTRLTIGDGLVTQVPALMVSLATALLVTKGTSGGPVGGALGRQMLANHRAFFAAAAFLLALLPSGLPKAGLLAGAAICGAAGAALARRRPAGEPSAEGADGAELPGETPEEKARSLLALEPIELEIGFRLIGLVDDGRGGDLMVRLSRLREKVALDLGFVVPPVKVVDNMRLYPTEYSIKLRGNAVGRWRIRPDKYLATFDGEAPEGLKGSPGLDPLTGRVGIWIDEAELAAASGMGLRVRKAAEVVAEHLEQVIRGRAAEILTREEVSRLVSDLKRRAPSLVDELIPETLKVGEVHKVLQGLLRERVSIRDLETILETLADHGDRTRDAAELTEHARRAVARTLCASIADRDGTIHALLLDPPLEEVLQGALEKTERGTRLALEPEMVEALAESVAGALGPFDASGRAQVLACPAAIRPHLRAFLAARAPRLLVLAYEEIAGDFRLEEHGAVSLPKETWSRR